MISSWENSGFLENSKNLKNKDNIAVSGNYRKRMPGM